MHPRSLGTDASGRRKHTPPDSSGWQKPGEKVAAASRHLAPSSLFLFLCSLFYLPSFCFLRVLVPLWQIPGVLAQC
jgi:hypothetical protein